MAFITNGDPYPKQHISVNSYKMKLVNCHGTLIHHCYIEASENVGVSNIHQKLTDLVAV